MATEGGTFVSVTGGTFETAMPGTFVSAAGGTFETVMPGTFHSATGGTFETVLGGTIKPLPSQCRQQTKKMTNISAIRRKLRDELRNHYLNMLFFNKKIVLPTPICKIYQLIQIDDKKSKPKCSRLAFSFLC